MTTQAGAAPASTGPPPGWYPDPSNLPRWRRWDGSGWGDATMPFSGPLVDPRDVQREHAAFGYLHAIAPVCLVAPAVAAVALATATQRFGALRHWFHLAWSAAMHGKPIPSQVNVAVPSDLNWINFAVYALSILGVLAWIRFAMTSMRVAASAGYPRRLGPFLATIVLLLPIAGPLVAASGSAATLPTGHEAQPVLKAGWGFVAAGEALFVAVLIVVATTPSLAAAWAAAAACAACWVLAAIELPIGFAAVDDDHRTLDVRREYHAP